MEATSLIESGYPLVTPDHLESLSASEEVARLKEQYSIADVYQMALKQNYLLFYNQVGGYSIGPAQQQWYEVLQNYSKAITLAPRGEGKSEFWSVLLPLWIAYQGGQILREWVPDFGIRPEIFVFSESRDLASDILLKISSKIESDPRLIHLSPIEGYEMEESAHFKKKTWSKTELITSTGVRIKSKAFLSRTRGGHPPVVILDDVLSEHNSLTIEARKKTASYFNEAIYPMLPKPNPATGTCGGRIYFVGTAQHIQDLYHEKGQSKNFHFLKQAAYTDVWVDGRVEHIPLSPERHPYEYLMEIKADIGELAFQKEYMNCPMSDELSLFPMTVLEKCFDENLSYEDGYDGPDTVYLGADFSVPGEQNSDAGDYTVVSTGRMTDEKHLVLLNFERTRGVSFQQQCQLVRRMYDSFQVDFGLLEANMFQRIYALEFKDTHYMLEGNVVTASGKRSLKTGIPGLRNRFEHRQIRLPYRTQADKEKTNLLCRELNGVILKNGKIGNMYFHDDIVMSIYHLVCALEHDEESPFGFCIT